MSKSKGSVKLSVDDFGSVKNPKTGKSEVVKRYTWTSDSGMSVQAISYGTAITTMKVPDKNGKIEDVALGFDDVEGYVQNPGPYFGCIIGRCINRVKNAQFTLNGKTHQLTKNMNDTHQLHGGFAGFSVFNWSSYAKGNVVVMTHISEDGWENYPGTVMASVTMEMDAESNFTVNYSATCDEPTPVNLGNHAYFNMAGHGSGPQELYKHVATVNADRYTIAEGFIPTGEIRHVGGSAFDLRVPRELGPAIAKTELRGYDNNFCITKGTEQMLAFVGRVLHPESGRFLEVYSDQEGVQWYTSNNLPDPDGTINPPEVDKTVKKPTNVCPAIIGKGGAKYLRHGGFCLETQKYPDAVNNPHFPSVILNPGETYKHITIYKFGVYTEK